MQKILFFIVAFFATTGADAHSSLAVNVQTTSFSIFHSPFSIISGDITGMRWSTGRQGIGNTRAYAFEYDDLSRLTNSQFSPLNDQFSDNFSEKLGYDATGRIQTLQRYADDNTLMDDLEYAYSGAHLEYIHDKGTADGVPVDTSKYRYDPNGNMVAEGSTRMAYNLLNLPQQVQLLGGRSLKNTYAADGRKLIVDAQYTTGEYEDYRSYSGNLVFDMNDNLDHIVIPEGRIVHRDGVFTFEYHLRDHLGNTRVAFVATADGAEVVQENTYYPFGALIRDYTYSSNGWVETKLRYNGKELLSEFDLGWYDYGSRYYNPMLGMFTTVDPQAYRGYGLYPYAYCANNPVLYVDPNGEWFGLDDIFAMAIGGVVNVVSHAISGDIENVGHAFALFGVGAAAGEATLYGGPLAGGAVLGAGNSIINQGFTKGWDNISFSQVIMGTAMGMGTSYLGGQISTWMSPVTSQLFANVSSPVVQQTLTNMVTNSASGFVLGTGISLMNGASVEDALKDGGRNAIAGGGLGLITGFAGSVPFGRYLAIQFFVLYYSRYYKGLLVQERWDVPPFFVYWRAETGIKSHFFQP